MSKIIQTVTARIRERSQVTRERYLTRIAAQAQQGKTRSHLSCGNLAHAIAACPASQKDSILDFTKVNIGIVTAYNDMLSAHQPYQHYPDYIKQAIAPLGHSAQVAGGVPAMCDGVTQGQVGMDLSLFSRDIIAQATAISLSHNTFDATLLLGICDKIAPGQLMGALSFGHLPTAFVPAGPMKSGITNDEKTRIRQEYAKGKLGKNALQLMENSAYHAPGTCTFYGTANTNQLVFEAMGLMLPGSAFVPHDAQLRTVMTATIAKHMIEISQGGGDYRPLAKVLTAESLVNGLVALLASGGSTNHTIHMIAIAKAAGLILTWEDFDVLSDAVPLLVKMYPNGPEDINAFQAAGGVPTLMKGLYERGLLNLDVMPVYGTLDDYLKQPCIEHGALNYTTPENSTNGAVISLPEQMFSERGGLKLLTGNLGRGVIKISAVAEADRVVAAPAMVFESQHDVEAAYQHGLLNKDVVVVLRHNGPVANGMPELHKLMPLMGNLMKSGYKVALVTDGRLSGASGKVPAAIHLSPEAYIGGPLSLLQDGDWVRLDANTGVIETAADLSTRVPFNPDLSAGHSGAGREWFSLFRKSVSRADEGATILE